MNASELREQTVEELEQRERELTRELWNNRMKNYTNQLDDTASLHRIRREIARIKTILGERRAAAAKG
ncbi:MAG: 50S ribosomal protein L29 [Sandaracinaceae bacterium]|nr:50S ribosomal protein L29 [Sandaracinaceae bacterium]